MAAAEENTAVVLHNVFAVINEETRSSFSAKLGAKQTLTSFPSTLSSNCVSLKWTFVIRGLKKKKKAGGGGGAIFQN